ncbi:sensor histidine kinase [Kitasatospora sp. NBC_00315]|uniref:sensor histidine kinase n=1 Tax=Kitasatospora sp. NBC_00315 TaxID=2975963 RepID=UPI0032472583
MPGPQLASVMDLAVDRVQQGMRISDSAEAGVVLFEIVMDVLVRELTDEPGAVRLLERTVGTLQRGIGLRLQVGSAAYDSFLLNTVTDVNRRGYLSLARDIHDQMGNSLSVALRQIDLYEMTLGEVDEDLSSRLKAVRQAVHESLLMARDMVSGLRRHARDAPLKTALTAFVESMDITETEAKVYVNGSESWAPPETLDELYVLLRECLRNSFAHARADKIVVRVDIAPHEIHAIVGDDGCGFDLSDQPARKTINGLTGIRERVALLDGTVAFSSALGKGTTVKCWVPIREEATTHGQ